MAYDKYLHKYGSEFVEEVSLDKLLAEADIISLHIPLTAETREMVDSMFLEKCRDGCILINTSRGKNINLGDVVAALRSGKLGGVCLDVFPSEPPASGDDVFKSLFEELCGMENVVMSPHVAGWTVESKRKIAEVLLRKIESIAS